MSDSTYRDFLDGLKGIYRFAKEISLTFESYRSWYQKNAATINAYLNAFADFGVWCLAVQKMSERQIVFTDDLTNEFAKNIYVSPDLDATLLSPAVQAVVKLRISRHCMSRSSLHIETGTFNLRVLGCLRCLMVYYPKYPLTKIQVSKKGLC